MIAAKVNGESDLPAGEAGDLCGQADEFACREQDAEGDHRGARGQADGSPVPPDHPHHAERAIWEAFFGIYLVVKGFKASSPILRGDAEPSVAASPAPALR